MRRGGQLDRASLASVQQVCILFIPILHGCACLDLKDHPDIETGFSCPRAFLRLDLLQSGRL